MSHSVRLHKIAGKAATAHASDSAPEIRRRATDSSEPATGDEPPAADLFAAAADLWRQHNEQHWIHTQGESMLPLIREDDRLLINFDLATVRRGSIVLFSQNGRLVAHRVIRVLPGSPPRFLTKGDNAWRFDTLSDMNLLGQVVAIHRQDGLLVLDTPKWRRIGWLIATSTLWIATLFDGLRSVKRHTWGIKPIPGAQGVRRCGRGALNLLLSLALQNGRKSM
jgi:hypothetical protein